jgi:hypothetical protein
MHSRCSPPVQVEREHVAWHVYMLAAGGPMRLVHGVWLREVVNAQCCDMVPAGGTHALLACTTEA